MNINKILHFQTMIFHCIEKKFDFEMAYQHLKLTARAINHGKK